MQNRRYAGKVISTSMEAPMKPAYLIIIALLLFSGLILSLLEGGIIAPEMLEPSNLADLIITVVLRLVTG